MADETRIDPAPRARPVADVPGEALAARADELARRWAIALIVQRPLLELGELPLEDLAREAPALCAESARALQSDEELHRLIGRAGARPAPALRLAAISGARDAAAAARAAEALRGVLWEGLLEVLDDPSPRQLGDAGDRLAHVCAAVLAAALEAIGAAGFAAPAAPALAAAAGGSRPRPGAGGPAGAGPRAVLVDERAGGGPAPPDAHRAAPARAWTGAEPPEGPWPAPDRPPASPPRAVEIEIRDERREGGAAAWIGSIGARLERFAEDGVPFAVLLVELLDGERLRAEEPPGELDLLGAALQDVLAAELAAHAGRSGDPAATWPPARSPGSLMRERAGRFWLLAAGADRAGGQLLGERIERAAAGIRTARGRPLAVAVGAASCPQDGREAAALAAHADVGLYAARAAARRSSPAGERA